MIKLVVLLLLFSPIQSLYSYQIRLHLQEKENIIKAVNSGTKLYALKKNSILYDLITNKTFFLKEPIIAAFFNEPTLSGHRYMETNKKVRYIVDPEFLRDASQVTKMRPSPKVYKPTPGKIPGIPVGAPHEFKQ